MHKNRQILNKPSIAAEYFNISQSAQTTAVKLNLSKWQNLGKIWSDLKCVSLCVQ